MISSVYDGRRDLPGVQVLRAIAALAVVAHHALEESNAASGRFSPDWLTTAGASGVDIFFVISGFIMLVVAFGPEGRLVTPGAFLVRRFTRIYPFYWLCCLAMTAIVAGGFLRHHALTPGQYLTSWLLAPNSRTLIGVSWTLVYEVYFYLIFAATLLLRSRLASAAIVTAVIALAVAASPALPEGALRSFLSNPIALEFCLGLWLAVSFSPDRPGPSWRLAVVAALAGFLTLALAPLVVAHDTTARLPGLARLFAWGAPSALVVWGFISLRTIVGWPGRMARRVGDASYAVYLTHEFVMIGYARLLKVERLAALDQRWIVPGVVLICALVGVVAHRLLERPLLAATRRLTHFIPVGRAVGRADR